MLIDRIFMCHQSLMSCFPRLYTLICIFSFSLDISGLSKAFALPPIIDLYSEPYEQNTYLSQYSKKIHRSKQTLQPVKHTVTTQYAVEQLKKQIQYLDSAFQNSQRQIATQEKIIQTLQERLSQTSRKALEVLPSHTKHQVVQNSDKPSVSKQTGTDSKSLADWKALKLLLKSNTYQASEVALKKFIKQYPKDLRIADAHYLLGQVALIQGKPDQALSEFNTMTRYYPKSEYIPYAHYHRALAYYAKGDHVMAESLFKKLEQSYPASEAARKAAQQREKLELI